jgi:hypothetical protein
MSDHVRVRFGHGVLGPLTGRREAGIVRGVEVGRRNGSGSARHGTEEVAKPGPAARRIAYD